MLRATVRCGNFSREAWSTHWRRGDGGYDWKHRHLTESRDRAMTFLFDVSKRRAIHDAIRRHSDGGLGALHGLKAQLSEYDPALREKRLRGGGDDPDVMHDLYRMEQERRRLDDEAERKETDDSTPYEFEGDGLEHLTEAEVDLLTHEFYPQTYHTTNKQQELMDGILRTRHSMSPKLSYTNIPEAERNVWSAWYLRHLAK